MRQRAWLVYLAVALPAATLYLVVSSPDVKTALVIALAASTAIAVGVGIALHRPSYRMPWLLVAALHSVWAVGWIFWQRAILERGEAPPVGSWESILFLCSNPLLPIALVLILRRVDPDRIAFADAAIFACAMFAISWAFLLHVYIDAGLDRGAAVQITYAVVDIVLLAIVMRLALGTQAWTASFSLLIASAVGLIVSDLVWNWTTQLADYSPGSWADGGWMAFHVLGGAAALHPSMRDVGRREEPGEHRLRWLRLPLLAAAAIIPAVTAGVLEPIADHPDATGPVVVVSVILTGLVFGRLAINLRETERLAKRLGAQNIELRELDRLKDDFVASVSHELRTPLTSIQGYLELVLDGEAGDLNEEQRQFLSVVDRNADRLLRVVSDLLFVAQVDAGRLALEVGDVDVATLAANTVEAARPAAEAKGVALGAELGGIPPLRGDASRLAQLLDNLVSNAIKFTPSGGRVDVRARAEGGVAVLEVADTGMGIARDDQEHLFDRFFRTSGATDQAIQGTGLGLAIAKAIVDAHGGAITVRSAEGAGTTFRVELPLSQRAESAPLAATAG